MQIQISILFFLISLLAPAQVPEIDWRYSYGGSQMDRANSILQCSDGGYIVTGSTRSNDGDVSGINGDVDVWVYKLGPMGDLVWQNCLGGSYYDAAQDVIELTDGGFVIAGNTESEDGDVSNNNGVFNAWVVKLDVLGALQWERSVGGTNHESVNAVVEKDNGDLLLAGGSFSSTLPGHIAPGWDAWVFELDASGNVQQQTCYGTSGSEWFNDIVQTDDGGYICIGQGPGENGAWNDVLVMKFDAFDVVEWQRTYGGTQPDEGFGIQGTSDGGFVFVGTTGSDDGDVTGHHGGEDAWMVKIDQLGIIGWQRALGGSFVDGSFSITTLDNGDRLAAGHTSSTNGDVIWNLGSSDLWLIRMDADGELLWQKCYGGSGGDAAYDIELTNDGGVIMCGETNSADGDVLSNNGANDAWVIKLKDFPLLIDEAPQMHITVSPNPALDHVVIRSNPSISGAVIRMTNAVGREVLRVQVKGTRHQIDLSDQAKGIYLVTLQTDQGVSTQRLVLE